MSHDATNWAIKQRGLKPATKLVLWHLCDRYNPDYGCFPKQETLAHDCEMSRSAVNEHLIALEKAGLIAREQRRDEKTRKQISTNYRFAFETDFPCPESGHGTEHPVSGFDEKPCPENAESRVRIPDTNIVIEPVREPVIERGGASENEFEIEQKHSSAISLEENPKSAAFEKRVIRFCSGVGYHAGKWPNWDTGKNATLTWIKDRFAELSPDERAEAERWRCAYLLDIASRKEKPKPVGVFIQDKLWNALDPAILDRLEDAKATETTKSGKPDGWAACFGPVGMARLFGHFYEGAADPELASQAFLPNALFAKAWPQVMRFRMVQQQKGGALFGQLWQELAQWFEPVPQGTEGLEAWRREFKRRNWPWLSEFDRLPVVYCPKGGVAGLAAFEAKLSEVKQDAAQ